jgi:hypothetical protein
MQGRLNSSLQHNDSYFFLSISSVASSITRHWVVRQFKSAFVLASYIDLQGRGDENAASSLPLSATNQAQERSRDQTSTSIIHLPQGFDDNLRPFSSVTGQRLLFEAFLARAHTRNIYYSNTSLFVGVRRSTLTTKARLDAGSFARRTTDVPPKSPLCSF